MELCGEPQEGRARRRCGKNIGSVTFNALLCVFSGQSGLGRCKGSLGLGNWQSVPAEFLFGDKWLPGIGIVSTPWLLRHSSSLSRLLVLLALLFRVQPKENLARRGEEST